MQAPFKEHPEDVEKVRETVRTNFERGRLWGMSLKQKLAFKHGQLCAGLPAPEIQRHRPDHG